MASDMGGFVVAPRYKNRKTSGFPSSPDNSATGDMRYFPEATQDSYFDRVKVLLHGDGPDPNGNGTNSGKPIYDSSKYATTVTVNGDCQASSLVSKFGGTSLRFDGAGDSLTVGSSPSFWNFLHQEGAKWTFDCYFYLSSLAALRTFFDTANGSSSNTGMIAFVNTSGNVHVAIYRGVTATYVVNGPFTAKTLVVGRMYHIELDCDLSLPSGNVTCFIDGVSIGYLDRTGDSASASSANRALTVGAFSTTYYSGYMDDFRLTDGVNRHTANFIPSISAAPDF